MLDNRIRYRTNEDFEIVIVPTLLSELDRVNENINDIVSKKLEKHPADIVADLVDISSCTSANYIYNTVGIAFVNKDRKKK